MVWLHFSLAASAYCSCRRELLVKFGFPKVFLCPSIFWHIL